MTATSPSPATILWDLDDCPPLKGDSGGFKTVRNLKNFIVEKSLSIYQMIAFTASSSLSLSSVKRELEECGVIVHHEGNGGTSSSTLAATGSSDIPLLAEIIKLVYFHRPPHALILVTGNKNITKIINFLDQVHYKIILLHPPDISEGLQCSVNVRFGWWEVLGCLESDIKKLLPDDERPRSVESSGGRLLGDSIIEQQQQKAKPIKVSRERGDQSSRNSVASFNNDHSVLIEFLKNQTNYTSYFGLIGTGCRNIAVNNGCSTLKEYIFKAERDGAVLLKNRNDVNGHVIVQLHPDHADKKFESSPAPSSRRGESSPAPSRRSAPAAAPAEEEVSFDELVSVLEASKSKSLTVSDLGMVCHQIYRRMGFPSMIKYLQAAEQAGKITIIPKGDKAARALVQLKAKRAKPVLVLSLANSGGGPRVVPATSLQSKKIEYVETTNNNDAKSATPPPNIIEVSDSEISEPTPTQQPPSNQSPPPPPRKETVAKEPKDLFSPSELKGESLDFAALSKEIEAVTKPDVDEFNPFATAAADTTGSSTPSSDLSPPPLSKTISSGTAKGMARFHWNHPGTSVFVTGSWDLWTTPLALEKQADQTWKLAKEMNVGKYVYEFLVDGNSMVDDNQQFIEDDDSCHNIVQVVKH